MALEILPLLSIKFKYFTIFILFSSFLFQIQTLSFQYPTSFTLQDGRIFIIHSSGIDICNSQYTESNQIISFSTTLSQTSLSKISISKFSNGEFIIFIINKFYLFDENGNKKIETKILTSISGGEYFTLSAHKVTKISTKDTYYFLFGYIDKSSYKFNIFYYNINTGSDLITTLDSLSFSDNILYTGLSCEFSYYNPKDYFICVYENTNSEDPTYHFTLLLYYISGTTINFIDEVYYYADKIKYIRSTTKSIESKAFFCCLDEDATSYCFIFSAYDLLKAFNNPVNGVYIDDLNQKKCVLKPYNLKAYYFPESEDYVFSCLTVDGGIQTTIYDKNMAQISDIETPSARLQK